jgi:hypothetical protein
MQYPNSSTDAHSQENKRKLSKEKLVLMYRPHLVPAAVESVIERFVSLDVLHPLKENCPRFS